MPSQLEYNASKQNKRNLYVKISLMNSNYQVVDEWSNVVLGNPTFTNDSQSEIRRTCSLSLIPIDKSFAVKYNSKIWLDKYIQVFLGIEDNRTKEIAYTKMGTYLLENPSIDYNATSNVLTMKCIDLMAKLTSLRATKFVSESAYEIKSNTTIRQAIIAILQASGFTKYVVATSKYTIPNTLRVEAGDAPYSLLKKILEIDPTYQMYFDVDGVFHYEPIPSGDNETIMADDDLWKSNLISYSQSYDFDSIKNKITVIGKAHSASYYAEMTSTDGKHYIYDIDQNLTLYDGLTLAFSIDVRNTQLMMLGIKSGGDSSESSVKYYKLCFANGNTYYQHGVGTVYVARYNATKGFFIDLGTFIPKWTVSDTNPNSPYNVDGTMGVVPLVLSGGEYDNIQTLEQAQLRAKWELYKRCKLKDNITLTCIPIYWLDVNWVIEITLPNSYGEDVTQQYIITSINTTSGVSGTQTITASRYYPYYSGVQ